MRGQRQSPFRMIRWAQIVEAPRGARQSAIGERRLLPPPTIPELAHISIVALLGPSQFLWQQSPRSKQPRLHFQQRQFLFSRRKPLTDFPQPLHCPNIVLVSQRPKKSLPKRLLGAALARAGLELRCLADRKSTRLNSSHLVI